MVNLAPALGLEPLDDLAAALGGRHAVEVAGVHEYLVVRVLGVRLALVDLAVARPDDMPDRQPVRLREREVARVVRGDGHDRARAVVGQDVVGDEDGQALAVHRVDGVQARVDAGLVLAGGALLGLLGRGAADVLVDLAGAVGALGDACDELVLGRQHEERRAEERVRARREHRHVLVQLLDPELDLGAFRAADPVALPPGDRLRVVDPVEVVEQLLRVVRDPEEPLLHQADLDQRPAALAAAVGRDLLVREHGLVVRAPLHRRRLAVGEPLLEEAQELPLLPADVVRVVRRQLARPVVRPADALHRGADRLDVALDRDARRVAAADGGVLGREPERVPAHRVDDVHPVAAAEAGDDVADRVDEHVAHVQRPRRVRELLEHVRLRLHGLVGDLERVLAVPDLLPLRLDCLCVVRIHVASRYEKASRKRGWGS